MNQIILYIHYEDEADEANIQALRIDGFEVIEVAHTIEIIKCIQNQKIDLIIIDFGHMGNDLKAMKEIRKTMVYGPILIISYDTSSDSIIKGFNAGANDYIAMPVDPRILIVRIRNIFLLVGMVNIDMYVPITIGDLYIDPNRHQVSRDDLMIELTPKEYDLLLYLARHVNQVCSRDEILRLVWKYDYSFGTNVVDVYIRYLRLKIDKGHRHKMIHTSRGVGYILIGI
ncbi:response regulator transcription factor [Paenibacillus sp. CMAA1364]